MVSEIRLGRMPPKCHSRPKQESRHPCIVGALFTCHYEPKRSNLIAAITFSPPFLRGGPGDYRPFALSLSKGEWLWTITSTASTNVIPALSGNPGALAIVAIVGWVK